MSTHELDDWEEVSSPAPMLLPGAGPAPGSPGPGRADLTAGPPVVLRFLEVALTLTVAPGTVVALGRDPDWAPRTAAAFAHHHTVSTRHAGVAVAADGSATVTEELPGAANGTRLNKTDLVAGVPYPLTDRDRLWLGPRISCVVQLGRRLPETG
ncbi:hypothetical protein [Streptomyces sp. NPDC002054]|uniref:hypothetical protein n=1 Tax=Streptomyces sp. NPDC002054 TaxID=3154663 RepID=UPI003323613F